jgi:hypothetical protein
MMLHPFLLGASHALFRQLLAPRLPLFLAVHAMRCMNYQRHDDRPYRRSDRRALSQSRRQVVDGDWNLVLTTPMGKRDATLNLKAAGGILMGTQGADNQSAKIFDGTVTGSYLTWKVSISSPMPLTLNFEGTIAGDEIIGEMSIDSIGRFPFTGSRGRP